MAADTIAATAGPPPTADPQDPLPESAWGWRRGFVFLFGIIAALAVAAVLAMLYMLGAETLDLVGKLSGARDVRALDQSLEQVGAVIQALYKLGSWAMIVIIAGHVLYLIAPSAEQAAKMLATVSAWKAGVSTASLSRSIAPDGGRAEAATSAGISPPPITVPAPEPEPPAAEVDAAPTGRAL